jgi:hypothetical protein
VPGRARRGAAYALGLIPGFCVDRSGPVSFLALFPSRKRLPHGADTPVARWGGSSSGLSIQLVAFDPVEHLGLGHRHTKFSIEPLRTTVISISCPLHAATVML